MAYGELPVSSTFLGYYHMDELGNYEDVTSYARDMTYWGSVALAENTSRLGVHSIKFPGSVGTWPITKGSIYSWDSTPYDSGNLTISCWVRKVAAQPAGYSSQFARIVTNSAGGGDSFHIGLYNPGSGDQFQWQKTVIRNAGNQYFQYYYTYAHDTVQWIHMVLTFDGTYILGYLDGLLRITSVDCSIHGDKNYYEQTCIGGGSVDGVNMRYGPNYDIDDVVFDTKVWSAGDIKRVYELGRGHLTPGMGI